MKIMVIWCKECLQNWKIHIFMLIQLVFIFALVNLQVSSLAEEYYRLTFAEETGEQLYIYQNCMGCLKEDSGEDSQRQAEEVIRNLGGVEDIGYDVGSDCTVDGYGDFMTDIDASYLSPLLWKNYRYNLVSGSWFGETEEPKKQLSVIIGGGLSEKYEVGDTIPLTFEETIKKEAVVIGDLGERPYIFLFNGSGADQTFLNYSATYDNVLLFHDASLIEELEYPHYPYFSVMLKLEEGAETGQFKKYGKLVSFDYLAENTENALKEFIKLSVIRNGIWIVVIVFGVAGSAYLIARKKRYQWGIYSLLGMTGGTLLRNMLTQNFCTYLIGTGLSVWVYPYIKEKLFYTGSWSGFNWWATGILFILLFGISVLCNLYICRIEPKEILTQVKE